MENTSEKSEESGVLKSAAEEQSDDTRLINRTEASDWPKTTGRELARRVVNAERHIDSEKAPPKSFSDINEEGRSSGTEENREVVDNHSWFQSPNWLTFVLIILVGVSGLAGYLDIRKDVKGVNQAAISSNQDYTVQLGTLSGRLTAVEGQAVLVTEFDVRLSALEKSAEKKADKTEVRKLSRRVSSLNTTVKDVDGRLIDLSNRQQHIENKAQGLP